ncbi:MAG: YkgJ family cysteine cluster protein [Lutibacter sp.]|nr:YkgJ family cysteine cluster protein [Lutibacter sp.]
MDSFLKKLPLLAGEKARETRKYFSRLKKRPPKKLDLLMQDLHHKVFERINCLDCANCCKTTSPLFTEHDIRRIARHLRVKEPLFIQQYLRVDTDHHYVLQQSPCPFLDLQDHACSIYDVRPKACKEYPHTDRRRFVQLTSLTLNNTAICPATYEIVEALKKELPL